jgi:hypothetical protein
MGTHVMKRLLATCLMSMLATMPLQAQVSPFDMSPERPAEDPAPQPEQPAVALPPAKIVPAPPVAPGKRFIIPQDSLSFSGETGEKTWAVFITEEQAASSATLSLTYQNSLIVAPEWSTLTLAINNARIINEPVQSSENAKTLTVDIPGGVLKAGLNVFKMSTSLRHRTDCDVQSTYELWTEVDPSRTYLTFTGDAAQKFRKIDDVRAIGVDAQGRTTFNLVVPAIDRIAATAPMLHLAEALTVLANMPNQAVTISPAMPKEQLPGALTILLGTDEDFQGLPTALLASTPGAPVAAFVDDPATGGSVLRVRGPDWQTVTNAVASIVDPLKREIGVPRSFLLTQTWRSPNVPLFTAASRARFSELGVATRNFNGRRLRTEFAIGVPSDFYANEYGKATVLIDAAYSEDVLPGSQLNIYVNDNIAATLPITTRGGAILRHFPISFTMRHFRPGANLITMEAVLNTRSDTVCAPGTGSTSATRFALFDTSEFIMPRFARIGIMPNLAGLSGTSFPYGRSDKPLPLIINNGGEKSYSAAATLLARMSVAAGRPLEIDPRATANSTVNKNALIIGAIPQIESTVLTQTGIAETIRTIWSDVRGVEPAADTGPGQDEFDLWRERLAGRGWRGRLSAFDEWLNRTFNISLTSFSFYPGADEPYAPEPAASLLMAQKANPAGDGVWTLVTAPTDDSLVESVTAMTQQDRWSKLDGHISIYKSGTDEIQEVPVGEFTFVPTQPISFANMRLIVANWLSGNILSFSLLLILVSTLLGIATSRLLSNLGRRV